MAKLFTPFFKRKERRERKEGAKGKPLEILQKAKHI